MIIYAEGRGDEATTLGCFETVATNANGAITARSSTNLIRACDASILCTSASTGVNRAYGIYSTGIPANGLWLSFYVRLSQMVTGNTKNIIIVSFISSGGAAYVRLINDGSDIKVDGYIGAAKSTNYVISLNKVYHFDVFWQPNNGSNSVMKIWAAEKNATAKSILDTTGSQIDNTTSVRLGIAAANADDGSRACSLNLAGVAVTNVRRGPLQPKRGRMNRNISNSEKTWPNRVRRMNETGLVVV